MKKVLMIGMNADVGGIETYIMNLYRHLKNEYIIYFPYVENIAYEEEIKALGGKFIYNLPTSRRNPITYFKKIDYIFKSYHFDAVYHNDCAIINMDILKIAKRNNVPVRIFHAHNSSYTWKVGLAHRLEEELNRIRIDKIATVLFACSKNAGEFMFGNLPYIEIKNGIDTAKYAFRETVRNKKRAELNISDNAKVILFVGRFTEIKNPLYAIDIMKECYKIDRGFIGLICGDGPIAEQVECKIENERLEQCVRLLGNRPDINEIYSAADFLIMPSLFEGFPFVLVEAECSGLKCICSDNVEQNTNLIGTAEYYPLDIGPEGWAKRIIRLETEKDRSKYSKTISDAGYDINQTVKKVEAIFEGK